MYWSSESFARLFWDDSSETVGQQEQLAESVSTSQAVFGFAMILLVMLITELLTQILGKAPTCTGALRDIPDCLGCFR